ncbi:unnamed protein product [Darwinula stevensoni]|uniref:Peptidase S1 domain-containing protein n=1 Tax=Darwinula stevensoni TaxID=69355 RepID=A0A7R9FN84_9CRUS|nr:unnamed protein product [Darwinula stevensoni]CAG0896521.1 unnamed protein product [Darwinula stevensoni]
MRNNETEILSVQLDGSPDRHSIRNSPSLNFRENIDDDDMILILQTTLQANERACNISVPDNDDFHNFSECKLVSHIGELSDMVAIAEYQTVCRGDSGSPMVFPSLDSKGSIWRAEGIVSHYLNPRIWKESIIVGLSCPHQKEKDDISGSEDSAPSNPQRFRRQPSIKSETVF